MRLDGIWDLMDRDVRVARVYFDLSAVSVVEDEVRDVMNAERSHAGGRCCSSCSAEREPGAADARRPRGSPS